MVRIAFVCMPFAQNSFGRKVVILVFAFLSISVKCLVKTKSNRGHPDYIINSLGRKNVGWTKEYGQPFYVKRSKKMRRKYPFQAKRFGRLNEDDPWK